MMARKKLKDYAVRVRVVKIEEWYVQAKDEADARAMVLAQENVTFGQDIETVDWEVERVELNE